jgi:GGDEF domain-containing protein
MQLWILALTVILVLATGVALLMYPTVYSHTVNLTSLPARAIFFSFCGFSALVVGYFVDRKMVIRHLRVELENEKRQVAQIRQEASANLLTTLPGLNIFRDRLAMEYRRAANSQQPLSLLTVKLIPSHDFTAPGEIEAAFADAAKTMMRKLRGEDSIFLFAPGVFGIFLPTVDTRGAYSVRDRLKDGLHDAAGASNRFSCLISVLSFPEHVGSAREMEEFIQSLLPRDSSQGSNLELGTPVLGTE